MIRLKESPQMVYDKNHADSLKGKFNYTTSDLEKYRIFWAVVKQKDSDFYCTRPFIVLAYHTEKLKNGLEVLLADGMTLTHIITNDPFKYIIKDTKATELPKKSAILLNSETSISIDCLQEKAGKLEDKDIEKFNKKWSIYKRNLHLKV